MDQDFPRAILHVDGDSFFASCELARRPDLRGRPVVTGEERGIATAMNAEAKARGITRGMRIRDIRRRGRDIVILSSDYRMYELYARRMYAIVRRYADVVEEYSIDECFADLTDALRPAGMSYAGLAHAIQEELRTSLGITFSVGLGVNKSTAKIASKWRKPDGFTVIPQSSIPAFLKEIPIGKVWGIGSSTTVYLRGLGIATAHDLYAKDRAWVAEHCDRPLAEIYEEFHGQFVKGFELGRDPTSVQHTRTFHPSTSERAFLWSQISHHVEEACARLRAQGLVALRGSFFVKTQDFDYLGGEAAFPEAVSAPDAILRALKPIFESTYRDDLLYRAAGITLYGLRAPEDMSQTLFGISARTRASRAIHAVVDRLTHKFGEGVIYLGSSMKARKAGEERAAKRQSMSAQLARTDLSRLDLIYLGEVR